MGRLKQIRVLWAWILFTDDTIMVVGGMDAPGFEIDPFEAYDKGMSLKSIEFIDINGKNKYDKKLPPLKCSMLAHLVSSAFF